MKNWANSSAVNRFSGPGSKAWEITDIAMERLEAGEDIIDLGVGDPDFATPEAIRDVAIQAIHDERTHYAPIPGEWHLRKSIAEYAGRKYGKVIKPEQIIVFPGAQCSLYSVMTCLAEKGDEVIIFEPTYATYDAVIRTGGADVVRIPLSRDSGFALNIEKIEAAITDRTRVILINSPGNPAGRLYDQKSLEKVVDICRKNKIWLISDEVYWSHVYDGEHLSPYSVDGAEEFCFVVNSLSKSHAMTGWRIGWAIAPEHQTGYLESLAQCMFFGVTQFVQDAAAEALNKDHQEVDDMKRILGKRRDVLNEGLSKIPGLKVTKPQGGMFLLTDVSDIYEDGTDFARALLDEAGVAVVPGFAFGESVRGSVRIGYLRDEEILKKAIIRIENFVKSKIKK